MVMSEKEDVCKWFRGLNPWRRIDYLCGLLHLCHPLELRFIGTVLENLAKKDFNCLRDAENKANNPSELSNDENKSISDAQFRAKLNLHLALMHSGNGTCTDIMFGLLEKQFVRLADHAHDAQIIQEILTILTLACHHPSFSIHQKLRLGEVLKNVEEHYNNQHHQWDSNTFPRNVLPPYHQYPTVPNRNPRSVVAIHVHGIRDDHQQMKKPGPDYELHISWSNGDLTQSFMKYKDVQNLYHQICNRFPGEKRLHNLLPPLQGQRRLRHEKERVSALSSFFGELSRTPSILSCDFVAHAFQNGKPMNILMPSPASQPYFTAYSPDNRFYFPNPNGYRVMLFHSPPSVANIEAIQTTGLSSSTTSPSNSRSSSPAVSVNSHSAKISPVLFTNANAKNNHQPKGKVVSALHQKPAVAGDQDASPQTDLCQFLQLLGLEKYVDNFASLSVPEIYLMSREDISKLGLPPDAQSKLQIRLDQEKQNMQDTNGAVHIPTLVPKPEQSVPAAYPTNWPTRGQQSPDLIQQQYSPVNQLQLISPPYAAPSIPQTVRTVADSSQSTSEHCPPSLSPAVNSITDSPSSSSLSSPASVNLEDKTMTNHNDDSSGSEDDKVIGQHFEENEVNAYQTRGPSRPQQSSSLPVIHNNTSSPSVVDKGNTAVHGIASSSVVGNEGNRETSTPPMIPVTVLNGYSSDVPFPHSPYVIPYTLHQQQRFKLAQPTHTGPRMHKNVVNMPHLDITNQPPPPPPPGMNKPNPPNMAPIIPPGILAPYFVQTGTPNMLPPSQPTGIVPPPIPPSAAIIPPPVDNGGNIPNIPLPLPTMMPNYIPPQTRSVLTSISNSTGVISTTPSNMSTQQPMVASLSQTSGTSILPDQTAMQNAYIHSSHLPEGSEVRLDNDANKSNRPTALPPNMGNVAGSGSGTPTPSPPLQPKQLVTACIATDSSNPPHNTNMLVQHQPPMSQHVLVYGQVVPHQINHLPNSLSFQNGMDNVFMQAASRFPQMPPHTLYGSSQAYNPNPHSHPHHMHHPPQTPHSSINPSHFMGPSLSSNGNGVTNNNNKNTGKNYCYNCGQSGHKGNECKDVPMDGMTNSFRLNMKPKADSE